MSFGYDAHVVSMTGMVSTNRVADHASKLSNALATHRENDETVGRAFQFYWLWSGLSQKQQRTLAKARGSSLFKII